MKKIILKEKNNVWTLTLIVNVVILKKATLSGLYAFAEKVDILDLETVRGTMGLAGMLANDKVLSQEERDTAQSYYQTLNQRYRELSDHT